MTEAIEIKLTDIALLGNNSPRAGIDSNVVAEYAENIADLPPILVAKEQDGFGPYILIDGWHRFRAHKAVGRDTIMAIVDPELKSKDFFFAAVCANKTHGIRFTAQEKMSISKQLFIHENRSAAEISEAVGCSTRHASELIRELAQEKKQTAIKIAKRLSKQGNSQREIADILKRRGFKTSKSSVDRWLQPPTYTVKDKDAIQVSPQFGESPKRDIVTVDDPISEFSGFATDASDLTPEDFDKLYCVKCKKDSKERTGKWYKITVDTVDSSTVFDFHICSFCRRALGRWVRNE